MKCFICALALSFGVAQAQVVNTVNDGATIKAGTYLNTPDSKTTFINSTGTGITLNAGSNIRGAEFSNGAYTGNGGNIHIDASTQVVRLNGNIDVRSVWSNAGPVENLNEITTGGRVRVDAAYLFQNGNIYASGMNGGNVLLNVGGMTMGPTSRIDASAQQFSSHAFKWLSGIGGVVSINSLTGNGEVNISKGAFITTNGNSQGYGEGGQILVGNDIVIMGRAVNMDGILRAEELKTDNPSSQLGTPTIGLSALGTDLDLNIGKNAIIQTNSGGLIKFESDHNINQNGLVLSTGGSALNGPSGPLGSEGTLGHRAGPIFLNAFNAVNNTGRVQADGHYSNGGEQLGVASGFKGGDGGNITINAPNISNTGVIRAMGGNAYLRGPSQDPKTLGPGGKGGTVSFIGANPTGNGTVVTFGGTGSTPGAMGTIFAPDPATSTNRLIGVWKKN